MSSFEAAGVDTALAGAADGQTEMAIVSWAHTELRLACMGLEVVNDNQASGWWLASRREGVVGKAVIQTA